MSRRHERDLGREIEAALADPVLEAAMGRAMSTMLERRKAAWPSLDRFERLRNQARAIKDDALARQDELLSQFERAARAAGATVVRVQDGGEARDYVCRLAREGSVELIVKSKSMTSEEIHLRPALEDQGLTVVEGDLGERIIQLAGERPSHLVVPAIHKSKEEIISLFTRTMGIGDPPQDAEGLTRLVRADLRESFLAAQIGITGANFALADTGSIVLIENEGNASLATLLPPIHVVLMGREKLIPRMADLGVFLELLPASATGQKLTSYVSLVTGRQSSPLLDRHGGAERELHILVLDNGRSRALADPELRECLLCIRCGACLNACAPYTLVGGHVFGADPYPGGIGCAWTYMTQGHPDAWDFNGLCTTCSRCTEVCPVKIDIPWLNTVIRERNNREFGAGVRQRLFARTDLLGRALSAAAPLGGAATRVPPVRNVLDRLEFDTSRAMPDYRRETFRAWWHRHCDDRAPHPDVLAGETRQPVLKVALFVDCFTNHNLPEVGRAAVEVLERAGAEVVPMRNSCCGRGAISQGLLDKPRRWAVENVRELGGFIERGYDVVFIEPSCLSAVRDDYARLLETIPIDPLALRIVQESSYDITEYLVAAVTEGRLELTLRPLHETYVVHGHCHQKSLGLGSCPAELLRLVPGVTVHEVEALCCGLVGSFGYKKEYSTLSRVIGARLFEKISRCDGDVAACGISCRSQIEMGTGRRVIHPVEVLARASRP